MRSLIKKWGEAALAVLCVLTIAFAALYTRQDDLRRLAAQSAGTSQDQSLDGARQAVHWLPPVSQPPQTLFAGAHREKNGLWQFSPWIRYSVSFGQRVCAMNDGTVVHAASNAVHIAHSGGIETRYRGLRGLLVQTGDAVTAGQALGMADTEGFLLCALREDAYIDPLSLLP